MDFDVEAAVDAVAKASSRQEIERLALSLLGTYPNTYTLTKSMAEHMILKHREELPVVLLRPTIVGAAYREPVPGWVRPINHRYLYIDIYIYMQMISQDEVSDSFFIIYIYIYLHVFINRERDSTSAY